MGELWFKVRGIVAAVVALIACPCHLILTLPLLLSLTAGTALGAFLEQHTWLLITVSTVVFVGGLYLALRWGQETVPVAPQTATREAPDEAASLAHAMPRNGRPKVTLLYAPTCTTCPKAQALWRELQTQLDFQYEEVSIVTRQGRELAAKHGILQTPATLIDGSIAFHGVPSREEALRALHHTV